MNEMITEIHFFYIYIYKKRTSIMNLFGSHWLLGVSVLEMKLSDWSISRDPWLFQQTESVLGVVLF